MIHVHLFSRLLTINRKALQIPTVAKVQKLYDNYIADVSVNEQVTSPEIQEENDLLDAFLKTSVMKYTNQFLIQKRLVASGQKAFRNLLHELWFTLYSRGNRKVGSSAFEHVFLGELKRGEVSGMHNWIYFSHEESLKHANYMGWIKKLDFGTVPNTYTTCVKVPNTSTTCVKVPNTYTTCVKVPNTSTTCVKVPNTSTTCGKVPNTSTTCGKVPNTSTTCKGSILKLQHKWEGVIKPVGSMFVGTSPELEMALYTVCFLTRPNERCRLSMANKVFHIKTFTFNYRGKSLIGSAFPEI
uniref:EndoU domain-containing protein n=1 Tax=Timema poppense TaxID=170557 RepID=A0A7R9D3P7_TIMPO|nr:unnamed protein product [Timema poppensis]